MTAEAAFLLLATALLDRAALMGLGHAGHYTFSVLVAVSVRLSSPSAQPGARAAILEWTMAAVVAYFLIFALRRSFDETGSPGSGSSRCSRRWQQGCCSR
jgi:hypothetical protein